MDTSSINTEQDKLEFADSIAEYNRVLEEADEAILAGTEMYELINSRLQHLGQELHDYHGKLEADNGNTEQLDKRSLKSDQTSLNKENRIRMRAERRRKHRKNRVSRRQALGSVSSDASTSQNRHGRRTSSTSLTASINDAAVEETAEGTSELNEPRYCVCNQVSYGDMIACDNKKCAQEWFHYSCVAVTSPPKGKWYCPHCKTNMHHKRENRRRT